LQSVSVLTDMTTVRLEERAPVASPSGWHKSVRIDQIEATPGGSEHVLRSESYRYREGAQNETSDQREHRLGVRRNAKQRAYDKFDAEKVAKKRAKRSKRTAAAAVLPAPAAAVSPAAVPACVPVMPAGVLGWGGALPAFGTPELMMPRDIATERDVAILRAFRQEASPAAVLDRLQSSGLDDDEPWTEQRVLERHDFLRRSVRTTARLVGPAVVASSMHELVALCM